ncbi:hypothetical protein HU200_056250 [Digitaria exilis]|uniref:BTB domain-containing protein n=1 Tax=Digitaria exilis TaxID=1010633 RepID=A0A835AHW8_9POAL|nr:hypothetical protein HU200_056250 [Digitaria exilis]
MQSTPIPQPPPSTTSSTSAVETVQGTHIFHVCGYSPLRSTFGAGNFVPSGTFAVGGYLWSLRFCPAGGGGAAWPGRSTTTTSSQDCSFHAELMTKGANAKACFTIGLLNQADGSTPWEQTSPLITLSTTGHGSPLARIAVVKRSKGQGAIAADLPECLGSFLEEGIGSDVTIHVEEETFPAHKVVLAMRSPVFKAQLYGPMRERREMEHEHHLTIDDMQPAIFRALLRFIYTDSLPAIGGRDEDDRREMICHLLVAADRYAMERLKTMCQGIICRSLTLHTVAATLALADQHHCDMLKDACMEFIFSPNRLGDVVESHGYAKLKSTCPSVLVEILEKSSMSFGQN